MTLLNLLFGQHPRLQWTLVRNWFPCSNRSSDNACLQMRKRCSSVLRLSWALPRFFFHRQWWPLESPEMESWMQTTCRPDSEWEACQKPLRQTCRILFRPRKRLQSEGKEDTANTTFCSLFGTTRPCFTMGQWPDKPNPSFQVPLAFGCLCFGWHLQNLLRQ